MIIDDLLNELSGEQVAPKLPEESRMDVEFGDPLENVEACEITPAEAAWIESLWIWREFRLGEYTGLCKKEY